MLNDLKDWVAADPALALLVGGALTGAVFGTVTLKTNFCTMGALSDAIMFGDLRRFRAWLLAIAVAIAGTQGLVGLGAVDVGKSMYLAPTVNWLGNLAGGAMMGIGMVLAGGCPSRNLARAGSGDLRALMTLILIGIFAYVTIGGVLAPARSALESATSLSLAGLKVSTQGVGDVLARLTAWPVLSRPPVLGLVVAAALAVYCFADQTFRGSWSHVVSGLVVGLTVAAGWLLTGLAYDELAAKPVAPISLTFVRPSGDTLEWLQRYTAIGMPGFGISSLLGAMAGAFGLAAATGRLHVTTFADTSDTLRCLGGAALMGIGGVLAMGCTVGQGITGLSTLAIGSLITFVGIVAGGVGTLKQLEKWL